MIELRHLRYFLAIAEKSSFTRAAAWLRITQPTLSHQIRQLERTVGTPLFDRAGSAVRLNEQGKVFRGYAERALKEVDAGSTVVAEMAGQMHGQLTIGVFRSYSGSLLPDILARFSARHPEVRVEVRQLSRRDMERQLINGELNVAIGYSPPSTRRIVAEHLFSEPLVLVVGRLHSFFGRRQVTLKELHGMPLALLSREFPSRQLIDRCLESNRVAPRVMLEMNSNEAILATVRCSALATLRAERTLSGMTDLHAARLSGTTLERSSAIFWSRGGYRSAAARAVADIIRQAYASHASRRGAARRSHAGRGLPPIRDASRKTGCSQNIK